MHNLTNEGGAADRVRLRMTLMPGMTPSTPTASFVRFCSIRGDPQLVRMPEAVALGPQVSRAAAQRPALTAAFSGAAGSAPFAQTPLSVGCGLRAVGVWSSASRPFSACHSGERGPATL